MDPISVGLLLALAGGAGDALGRDAWSGLRALVRRPFRHGSGAVDAPQLGEAELEELERAPTDRTAAQALSTALAARADADPNDLADLQRWHEQARRVRFEEGDVRNMISGGTFYGPVVQGRDFPGASFVTGPPADHPAPRTPPAQG
ncbi:hypothetical protein OHB39_22045 [Streptomyces sp. NBC_00047]|uniref:hypothetical protein n=1 Tax=Streptomyces sp. NBC_00047 TaxID=2975627 RepID=UPI002255B893|nr:hypothetical protein [Streptomyces sp. NBC_00047]MCX5610233.1 hypothetical protein [Streptomyces sp. NBC_00047]